MIRTTEQIAPAVIAGMIPKLTALTTDQPTTAEIEEALLISKAITRALFEWLSFRYSNHAKAVISCPAIPVETYEEAEALDRIEHIHPVFAPMLRGLAG